MRKVKAILLTITLLTLASCSHAGGRGAEELALDFRTDILAADSLMMVAGITADYGDRVYDFGVRYTANDSGCTIDVLSPDEIAGVSAKLSADGAELMFDGARLDTGALTAEGLSPIEALPVLVTQWREGHIKLCAFESLGDSDTVAIETDITSETAQKTWFDIKTLLPLRAELYAGGVMVIACAFENVVIDAQG